MFGFKGKYGLSFSWKRLLGISGFRNSLARKTGIPTTKGGVERKIGRWILRVLFNKVN
jgi:hypothetical protein